jgi:hypothetical protein
LLKLTVEKFAVNIYARQVFLTSKADHGGHNLDLKPVHQFLRKIAGAVGNDPDAYLSPP